MNEIDKLFSSAFELFNEEKFNDSLKTLGDVETYYSSQLTLDWKISIENLKGFNYLGLSLINDAQYCFEGSLLLDEKSSQACAGLGEVFFLKNEEAKAKVMFEYALLYNSENSFAQTGLEKVNDLLNLPHNHNTLIEPLEMNAEEKPDYKSVISAAGEYFSNNEYKLTIDSIQSVEERIEDDYAELRSLITELANLKGMSFLNLDELDEARTAFEKALNLTPDSSSACWGLAEVFFRNQMLNEAKTMFEWAVTNDPENSAAKEGLEKTIRALSNKENQTAKPKLALKLASGKTKDIQ